MKKIWQKNIVQSAIAEDYCSSENVSLDNNLIFYDAIGSIAHARMLSKIGVLSGDEFKKLARELNKIIALAQKNEYKVEPGDEDVHTKVENTLTENLGDLGKKIHTARSRNDQVLTDLRLWSKEQAINVSLETVSLVETFFKFASKFEFVPMPGYTHMQKAMPSSVGLWAASFAESLLDDLKILKCAYELNDQCPLGSGASFGVTIDIDRKLVSELLGFKKVQNNVLYTQSSRVKAELVLAEAMEQIMITLSRLAQDLLLFTTSEFNFFKVPKKVGTGSSIMPQKNNFDVMEFLRARTSKVCSLHQMISAISTGLPSGYNSDAAETKEPFMSALRITQESIEITQFCLESLEPNEEEMKNACTKEIFAAHEAYQLVKNGTPFREAYVKVGLALDKISDYDPERVLKETKHIGAPGNLNLDSILLESQARKKWWTEQKNKFENSIIKLRELDI